jgi:pimeloyl-ACP methyl ester carboxylesterase
MPEPQLIPVRNGAFQTNTWTQGGGPPLLYLHGTTGLQRWPNWLERLSGRFRVVAPQHPGFGESTGIELLDDFLDLVLYYADFMEATGLERPAVVGHSFGASIAAELAAIYPGSVDKLVLVAPNGLWDDAHPITDIFAMTEPELVRISWHDYDAAKKNGLFQIPETDEEKGFALLDRTKALSSAGKFLWPIPDKGLKKRIGRIKAPSILVWGASDKIVPPAYGPIFQGHLTEAKVVEIPGAGHYPMIEQPERFIEALEGFLA